MVMAGPEKAEAKRVKTVKHTMLNQKLGCMVARPISGIAAAEPTIGMMALIK